MENDNDAKMQNLNEYLLDTRERFCAINSDYFDNEIPDIMVRISDRLYSRIGYAHSNPLGIVLSSRYLEKYGWETLDEVLKHEIAHIYAYHFYGERGHRGENFREACKKMGVSPSARTNDLYVEREKWHYRCRNCGQTISTYRPLRSVEYCDSCDGTSDETMLIKVNKDQIDMPLNEFRKKVRPKINVYRCIKCGREVRRYKRWTEKHSCAVCNPDDFDNTCLMELVRNKA
ncbi:sprT domain-containing protein [Methanocella sp. CWC-04]|uniref:SprT domain-containing protein n=1 Tax=Methanooceanicella nereidis TaxID=2052831 RepID=A0AAP2RAP6_9EURY|nr:SprT family zinc-dependent metalloprotease [Methanocella sp. CWC-04]MCD1294076.1 sprT domain-containing protein [Methanocella sp. CWC-04]